MLLIHSCCRCQHVYLEFVLSILQGNIPKKSMPLTHAMLREVTFSGLCPLGVARHTAGFILTRSTSSSREGSPRAVTDMEHGSSVDSHNYSGPLGVQSIILAGENAQDHRSWLEILAPKCDSASFVTTPDGIQSFTRFSRSIQSSSASTSSASSSSLLALAAPAGGSRRSGTRKSAMPYSFWSSRVAI
jgi:hypothetical protein